MREPHDISERVFLLVRDTFDVPANVPIAAETTSADVAGWDSLSYATLIMNVEEAFAIELPVERLFALRNVGELAALVAATLR